MRVLVADGPNGHIGGVCMVSTQQRYNSYLLVWNAFQSNVLAMGDSVVQYDIE